MTKIWRSTPVQRAYLAAFDLHVMARTDQDRAVTRRMMDQALIPMLADSNVELNCGEGQEAAGYVAPADRPHRDLVQLLLDDHRRQRQLAA